MKKVKVELNGNIELVKPRFVYVNLGKISRLPFYFVWDQLEI